MNRYLIESPHPIEKCTQAIKDLNAAGYLHFFEWGCDDNDHTGWAIVEAENAEHARQIVPWYLRDEARVVRLVKFDATDAAH
ncbi:MAG TPA: hypothetical protein VMT73_05240 [Anaerolineales bacterium]|nr:hypothetical protein [Anaerolineales bacterium]